jgi:hypothetical protein
MRRCARLHRPASTSSCEGNRDKDPVNMRDRLYRVCFRVYTVEVQTTPS